MAWATIEQVADHLGIPQDARMVECLSVSQAWCQRKRPDLPPAGPVPADVSHAVVIYAGLLYRERSTPQGIAGYESENGGFTDSTGFYRCLDLLGYRKPVAR